MIWVNWYSIWGIFGRRIKGWTQGLRKRTSSLRSKYGYIQYGLGNHTSYAVAGLCFQMPIGQNRSLQDVGLDGLNDDEERIIYTNGPTDDPAGDNYSYFGQGSGSVLDRYKNYNGTQGNSPIEVTEQFRGSYTTPDAEDLNQDNTMNTIDRYYQYRIPFKKICRLATTRSWLMYVKKTILHCQMDRLLLPAGYNSVYLLFQLITTLHKREIILNP